MIALIGGGGFLLLILINNMSKDSISKDSFYDTFNSAGSKVTVGNKDKRKTASLKANEEKIRQSSESYENNIKSNRKDEAFSLYEEILLNGDEEVQETITEVEPDPKGDEETKVAPPKIIYVERQKAIEKAEPKQEQPKERKFTRARSRTSNKSKTYLANKAEKYINAEEFEAITIDMAYPSTIKIRLLEDMILPDGRTIKKNTLMKGIPSDGQTVLNVTIPEYGVEVYSAPSIIGIPLTVAEGLKREQQRLKNTEISTSRTIPFVGNVRLSTGKKNHSQKVFLQQNRTIYLK